MVFLSVVCYFSICLNVLLAFAYDNHMDIGYKSTVILLFHLRYAVWYCCPGNNKCLIWSICLPASQPPILGTSYFHCHLSRHNKNVSHVSCSVWWFSLKTVNPNHRVHRSKLKLSKAFFNTCSMDPLDGIFLPSINTSISANSLSPKALQCYVTTLPITTMIVTCNIL